MLNKIHSIAKGFGAKLLLALLVLSFAVWGIGDMVNAPARNQAVATVGDATISQEAFKRTLNREVEKVRGALGENYTPDVLKTLQLPQQILKMMVGQSLMQQEVASLGLILSDDAVAKVIKNNPAFHDGKGNFSKDILRQRLANAGLTEKAFIDQVKNQEAGRLILDSLAAEAAVNDTAVKTLYLSRNQKRDVSIYVIDTSMVSDIKQPSKEEIETFYNSNTTLFSVPEYRTLSYLTFTADAVKKDTKIPDEALQAAYEEHQDEFRHEEKRTVEQLLYSSEEKAKEAATMAKEGRSFSDIAEATGAINKKNLSLGSVTEKSMFDGAGEKVFALEANGISEPIQSPFGWHVFRVSAIDPASIEPFEKVKDKLAKDLLAQKQEEAVGKFANMLEDAFAAGSSLQDIAKEHNLSVATLPAINAQGKTADGKEIDLPKLDKFLDVAFKLDEKTESSVTFSKGGTYYVVRADKVVAEHARPLEEVIEKATQLTTQAARQVKLTEMIAPLAEEFADSGKRTAAINRLRLTAKAADNIKRTDKKIAGMNLPETFVADMFVRSVGDATAAYALTDGTFAIAVVNKIIPATLPEDAGALTKLRGEMEDSFRNEIMDEYMNYLAVKHPVEIKTDAVSAAQAE
ncbi:MAG: SurA N-terminal domain-containing protein [Alphaproteobacteria bacterium]